MRTVASEEHVLAQEPMRSAYNLTPAIVRCALCSGQRGDGISNQSSKLALYQALVVVSQEKL